MKRHSAYLLSRHSDWTLRTWQTLDQSKASIRLSVAWWGEDWENRCDTVCMHESGRILENEALCRSSRWADCGLNDWCVDSLTSSRQVELKYLRSWISLLTRWPYFSSRTLKRGQKKQCLTLTASCLCVYVKFYKAHQINSNKCCKYILMKLKWELQF